MNKKPQDETGDFVYPPSRSTKVALAEFEKRIQQKSVFDWGITEIDKRVIPAISSDVISLIGRPGMGKTMCMVYLGHRFDSIIRNINTQDPSQTSVLVYATFETTVEEFVGIFSSPLSGYSLEDIGRGNADLKQLESALVQTLGSSLVVYGQSMENKDSSQQPDLPNLDLMLSKMRNEYGWNVKGVLVDYLQRIPHHNKYDTDRTGGVTHNLEMIKHLALKHGTPFWVAIQARRDVDDYKGLKFPAMSDGQWSSVIEQTSDKVFSLTVPSKYMELGKRIDLNGWYYDVTDEMIGIRMLKQRFGPADTSDVWLLEMDYKNLSLREAVVAGEVEEEEVF